MRAYEGHEQWIVWCGTNAEQDAIAGALGADCVSIYGSLDPEKKVELQDRWLAGEVKTIVTKPKIFGMGVNWQQCHRMIFVGLSDSYEQYYQAIRRCYRYGQTRVVHTHVVLSELEGQIAVNIARKEREANQVTSQLVRAMRANRSQRA